MAIFRVVLGLVPKVRSAIQKVIDFITKVYKRLGKLWWLITIILLWYKVLNALDSMLKVINSVIRKLRLIPIPQVKVVLTALGRLIAAIRRAVAPMRRFLKRNENLLTDIKDKISNIRTELKKIRTKLKRVNRSLLLMHVLASILEKQQDFIESIMGQRVKAMLAALLNRLEELVNGLNVVVTAALVIEAALATLLKAVEPLVRQIQSFIDGLKRVLEFLDPLKNALQALLNGLQQLMQNRIVKWIIDGVTWLMDQLDTLFNALLDRLGLNTLIDRIIQSIPGLAELLAALQQLEVKIKEIVRKVDDLLKEIRNIRKKLDEISETIDRINDILRGLLAYKALIELQIPEFLQLAKGFTPEISVADFIKAQDELLEKIEKDDPVNNVLLKLVQETDYMDSLLESLEKENSETVFAETVLKLQEILPEERLTLELHEGEKDFSSLMRDALKEETERLSVLFTELELPEISREDKAELAEAVSFIKSAKIE